eukprot:TRINITY_DN33670_c0_g1_i1.p1 TRINITY_DN33670_c0_g1~~TRINITY_DN33670_c0_g1_i1.p1  ORF type:complete len:1319 (-),score=233.81 TRINITY_DN33670_c0_g1_i1:110-3877(-)
MQPGVDPSCVGPPCLAPALAIAGAPTAVSMQKRSLAQSGAPAIAAPARVPVPYMSRLGVNVDDPIHDPRRGLEPLRQGVIVMSRFEVIAEIGGSANSRVYRAIDAQANASGSKNVALKVEEMVAGRAMLRAEAEILRSMSNCPWVPRLIGFFSRSCPADVAVSPDLPGDVLVLELLGEDLQLVQRYVGGRMGLPTTAHIGVQMLAAIEAVHSRGLIHRDVKPANFVLGRRSSEMLKVYLIDFGLARRHLDRESRPRPRRPQGSFVGTTHYASVSAFQERDLGRCDDLWSLAYSIVEMAVGFLPWETLYKRGLSPAKKLQAKRQVMEWKLSLDQALRHAEPHSVAHLCTAATYLDRVPRPLIRLLRSVSTLNYSSKPDYKLLKGFIRELDPGDIGRMTAQEEIFGREAGIRRHRALKKVAAASMRNLTVRANVEAPARVSAACGPPLNDATAPGQTTAQTRKLSPLTPAAAEPVQRNAAALNESQEEPMQKKACTLNESQEIFRSKISAGAEPEEEPVESLGGLGARDDADREEDEAFSTHQSCGASGGMVSEGEDFEIVADKPIVEIFEGTTALASTGAADDSGGTASAAAAASAGLTPASGAELSTPPEAKGVSAAVLPSVEMAASSSMPFSTEIATKAVLPSVETPASSSLPFSTKAATTAVLPSVELPASSSSPVTTVSAKPIPAAQSVATPMTPPRRVVASTLAVPKAAVFEAAAEVKEATPSLPFTGDQPSVCGASKASDVATQLTQPVQASAAAELKVEAVVAVESMETRIEPGREAHSSRTGAASLSTCDAVCEAPDAVATSIIAVKADAEKVSGTDAPMEASTVSEPRGHENCQRAASWREPPIVAKQTAVAAQLADEAAVLARTDTRDNTDSGSKPRAFPSIGDAPVAMQDPVPTKPNGAVIAKATALTFPPSARARFATRVPSKDGIPEPGNMCIPSLTPPTRRQVVFRSAHKKPPSPSLKGSSSASAESGEEQVRMQRPRRGRPPKIASMKIQTHNILKEGVVERDGRNAVAVRKQPVVDGVKSSSVVKQGRGVGPATNGTAGILFSQNARHCHPSGLDRVQQPRRRSVRLAEKPVETARKPPPGCHFVKYGSDEERLLVAFVGKEPRLPRISVVRKLFSMADSTEESNPETSGAGLDESCDGVDENYVRRRERNRGGGSGSAGRNKGRRRKGSGARGSGRRGRRSNGRRGGRGRCGDDASRRDTSSNDEASTEFEDAILEEDLEPLMKRCRILRNAGVSDHVM